MQANDFGMILVFDYLIKILKHLKQIFAACGVRFDIYCLSLVLADTERKVSGSEICYYLYQFDIVD